MRRLLIILISIFFFSIPCHAEESSLQEDKSNNNSMLSLDLSYSLTSILSHGWGVGLNYERSIFDYLSLKGNFGHMTLTTGIDDVFCTSVHISIFIFFYPLGSGLDKLYIGVGNGCDFMNYFGKGNLPPTTQDILIHVTSQLGWKFNVLKFLIIDISIGYKFIITETQNYINISDYVNTGFNFGLGFKILFNQIGSIHE